MRYGRRTGSAGTTTGSTLMSSSPWATRYTSRRSIRDFEVPGQIPTTPLKWTHTPLRASKKLDYEYVGPFSIKKVVNRQAYTLDLPARCIFTRPSTPPYEKRPTPPERPPEANQTRFRYR